MYPQSWKSAYIKKLYYNIIVTTVSVIAAVSIGFVELLQVVRATFKFNGSFWSWVQGVNLNWLGFVLVTGRAVYCTLGPILFNLESNSATTIKY